MYGDVTDIGIIDSTIAKVKSKYPLLLDFITADGGFDIKSFNCQEVLSTKLILSEIYLALNTQKQGGMFIIKFFDMFTHNSIICYLLLCSFYSSVKIIKPQTSRNSNSERYLICSSFGGINGNNKFIIKDLKTVISKFIFNNGIHTLMYPNFKVEGIPKLKELGKFNNLILLEQVRTINESIKMVHSRDTYFQNLILRIFLDKVTINYIFFYKNILNSRIIKCIQWLKEYKINTHQFVYRY